MKNMLLYPPSQSGINKIKFTPNTQQLSIKTCCAIKNSLCY